MTLLLLAGLSALGGSYAYGTDTKQFFVYPLKVSANGRYLVDQNNVPFLLCGDVPQVIVTMALRHKLHSFSQNERRRASTQCQ